MKLTYDDIVKLNKVIMLMNKQDFSVLSENNILSALSVQDSYYETDTEIAAAMFRSLCLNHGFINGNKRTAVLAAAHFHAIDATPKEVEQLALNVSAGKIKDVKEIEQTLFIDNDLLEEYLDRDTLISRIRGMGYKYNFNKYTDEQLFNIYKDRKYYKEKRAAEDKAQKAMAKDHKEFYKKYKDDNDVTFDGDSFWFNDMEFESDEAARDYFSEGKVSMIDFIKEAMNLTNEKKKINEGSYISSDEKPVETRESILKDKINKLVNISGFELDKDIKHDNPDISVAGNSIHWQVVCPIDTISTEEELEEMAKPLIDRLDKFEEENPGYVITYNFGVNEYGLVTCGFDVRWHIHSNVRESLRNIDREIFDKYGESYELEMFYESIKTDLTPQEEQKIKDFVSKPGITAEEAKTFITGMEKSKRGMTEDFGDEEDTEVDRKFLERHLTPDQLETLDIITDSNFSTLMQTPDGRYYYWDDYDTYYYDTISELKADLDETYKEWNKINDGNIFDDYESDYDIKPFILLHQEEGKYVPVDATKKQSQEDAKEEFLDKYPEKYMKDCVLKEVTKDEFNNWTDYELSNEEGI